MRTYVPALLVLLATIWIAASAFDRPEPKPAKAPFAVVELFTSEGCSSCPPAEALLNELYAEADRSGTRIFPLAFHVDYWDRLGWKDRFSDAAYTSRQRNYQDALGLDHIYTPQMIVNGHRQFVGSSRNEALAAIKRALEEQAQVGLTLSQTVDGSGLNFELDDTESLNLKSYDLNLALVQRNIQTDVKRGENAGRKLKHDQVVRQLKTIRLQKQSGKVPGFTVELEPDADRSVIAFVQNRETRRIVAATSLDFQINP